jgi:hypothetical protein
MRGEAAAGSFGGSFVPIGADRWQCNERLHFRVTSGYSNTGLKKLRS